MVNSFQGESSQEIDVKFANKMSSDTFKYQVEQQVNQQNSCSFHFALKYGPRGDNTTSEHALCWPKFLGDRSSE